jgi:hypothetical protein
VARIVDLDKALPPDIKVTIRGKTYWLPGDCPVPLFLRIQQASAAFGKEEGAIPDLYSAVVDLFRERDPSITDLPIGIGEAFNLFLAVYNPENGEDEDDSRPPRTRGTGTSSSRAKTRSSS